MSVYIVLFLAFLDICFLSWYIYDQFMTKRKMDRARKKAYENVIRIRKLRKIMQKI